MKIRIILSAVLILALSIGTVSATPNPILLKILVDFLLEIGFVQEVNRGAELPPTIGASIGETLIRETPKGDFEPCLATYWTLSEDGLVLTFKLREYVLFQDGTNFNADAVAINFQQIFACNVPAAEPLIERKAWVNMVDTYTVELRMGKPMNLKRLLRILANPSLAIYSPKDIKFKECGFRLVGTGPFKPKEEGHKSPDYVLLERNDDYWGERPRLDEIRFTSIPEDASRVMMLKMGEGHVATNAPPELVQQLGENPDTHVEDVLSTKTVYIGMNTRKEPFQDKRVRQAVNYCVDKEEIVDILLHGFGRVSDAPMAPTIFGYQWIGDYPYDPEKGKRLLEEAGYKDGFETTLLAPCDGVYPYIAEAVQGYLAKCGIKVSVQVLEWSSLIYTLLSGEEHEMFLLSWTPWIRDAYDALFPLFHSTGSLNRTFYEHPAVDELLDRAETELDEEAGIALYREAMEIIWEDAPWLFLYTPDILAGVREDVHGLIVHPTGRIDASEAWLEE